MCVAVNATATPPPATTEWITDYTDIVSKFSLRSSDIPDDDMCYIVAGSPETIKECEFNSETQTFVVIHGWTVRQTKYTLLHLKLSPAHVIIEQPEGNYRYIKSLVLNLRVFVCRV